MAKSPAHKFGQIIGQVLEEAAEVPLRDVARRHGLYLDKTEPRTARRGNKTVKWTDKYGNDHDLDYVLERGGTEDSFGVPVAFIETAWRKYTKHARNKAQEIEGAVSPLLKTFWQNAPFAGAIIAGGFTNGAIKQLQSKGFQVLHFQEEEVESAFLSIGVDSAYGEETSHDVMKEKIDIWESSHDKAVGEIAQELFSPQKPKVITFIRALKEALNRRIAEVIVVPLHGSRQVLNDATTAVSFLQGYEEASASHPLVKYEVIIRYTNGDKIDAKFKEKRMAIQFLGRYRSSASQ